MTDTVIAPVIGTPEYDAAMVAKVDASAAASALAAGDTGLPPAQRPDNVPEEYWDAATGAVNTEALLAAVTGKATPATAAEASTATIADAEAAVTAAGVDYSALQAEYAAEGGFSDDTYAKLAAGGFDRSVVDSFVSGQESLADAMVASVHNTVGGADRFTAMTEWARVNMTASEIAAFNRGVGGDQDDAMLAAQGLQARYEQANGKQPQLLGGSPPSNSGVGYASRAEMTSDIRNPQYDKDPAYRAKVQSRIAASTAF